MGGGSEEAQGQFRIFALTNTAGAVSAAGWRKGHRALWHTIGRIAAEWMGDEQGNGM